MEEFVMGQPVNRVLVPTTVNFDLDCAINHAHALFLREVAGRCLRHVARDRVPMERTSSEPLGALTGLLEASDGTADGRKTLLLRHGGDALTLVELGDGWAKIATAGTDPLRVDSHCREVADAIRAPDASEDVTPITFWAINPQRYPRPMRRKVDTPAWEQMTPNYSQPAQSGMARLLELDDTPSERMILWHGPPGTGKTHALRALARAWRSWCDLAFIADPEQFFGGSPTYLFDVATDTAGRPSREADKRTKLIVLEDAGELMTVEARNQSGQGLSRLLNLTDGLIGQGLKVMVLITTNDPLSVLHPAVIRPGRCLAEIEFGPLDTAQANDWLQARDSTVTVAAPTTLADLYAILAGATPPRRRPPVGFTAALAAA